MILGTTEHAEGDIGRELLGVMSKNLELKARYKDLASGQEGAARLGARQAGVLLQTDTYFTVPMGRLKLRVIEGEPAVLIWYERPNSSEARICRYYLVPVPDPDTMKTALAAGLGIRGVIQKKRILFLWHNVRIHFDDVAGLGHFIEFEAVLSEGEDEATAQAPLRQLQEALRIQPADLIAVSYADLAGI
jgi:predicted adenylyl cyclase CyaB